MNKFKDLVICRTLRKRSYQYQGGEVKAPWKLRELKGDVLYNSYEEYEEARDVEEKKAKQAERAAKTRAENKKKKEEEE